VVRPGFKSLNRLPLPDELPYRFQPPRVSPFWVSTSRLLVRYFLRRVQWLCEFEFTGLEHLITESRIRRREARPRRMRSTSAQLTQGIKRSWIGMDASDGPTWNSLRSTNVQNLRGVRRFPKT